MLKTKPKGLNRLKNCSMRSNSHERNDCSVVFASASIGCGHTRAAVAIKDALTERHGIDSAVFLDGMADSPAWFPRIYRDGYLAAVRFFPDMVGYCYATSDSAQKKSTRYGQWIARAEDHLLLRMRNRPELRTASVVISTHFLTSGVLARMRERGELLAPLITVVTDEHPHATWLHRGSDLTCVASEAARDVAIAGGLDPLAVAATGIPVDPRLTLAPQTILGSAGVDRGDRPIILICGGGHGLGALLQVVQSVIASSLRVTVIVVCGKNEKLRRAIEALPRGESNPTEIRILGYTNQMHALMASADLLVGKPGGLTSTEARAIGLPMMLLKPIPGQEEHNARMLVDCGAAVRLLQPQQAGSEIAAVLADTQTLWRMRAASAAAGRPHAAFDIANQVMAKANNSSAANRHDQHDKHDQHDQHDQLDQRIMRG